MDEFIDINGNEGPIIHVSGNKNTKKLNYSTMKISKIKPRSYGPLIAVGSEYFGVILDEKLDDDVAKLDLHDCRHSLLLTAHQRRTETNACRGKKNNFRI